MRPAPGNRRTLITILVALAAAACAGPATSEGEAGAGHASATVGGLPEEATGWGLGDPWNDGLAEMTVMRGTVPRYGEPREVELRLVTVAEDLDAATLVKSDRPAEVETIRVLKLNLKRRFTTGVYDYDQMASVFLEAGSLRPVKETVTHHELCGNAFSILEAPAAGEPATLRTFTYFDGFAEGSRSYSESSLLTPEALPAALRGVPREEGWSAEVRLLPGLVVGRPQPGDPETAIVRVGGVEAVETGLGDLPGRLVEVERAAGIDRLWFEETAPGRLLRWETAEGLSARLDWADRLAYWTRIGVGDEALLEAPPAGHRAPSGGDRR
jgi:hypothetical protein